MFARIGLFAAHHARTILACTVLVVIAAAGLGFTAFGKLKTEGFTDPAAESTTAQRLVDERFGGRADLVFLVDAGPAGVGDPAVARAGQALTVRLADDPVLSDVTSYFGTGARSMRSADGRYALAVAGVENDDADTIAALRDRYGATSGPITVTIGGGAPVGADIRDQVGADLAVAESIAVPLVLILLLLAFGSLVAASLPLVIGVAAALGTFAELAILGSVTDVSIFAVNLTTALGLGLAVDYALLMVSRFREELGAGRTTYDAVARTVQTAGRTIAFSAATVAAALAVLLVFPLYFLRSFAYAGIGVVAIALVSTLLVLPALLALLGPKIDCGRLPWTRHPPSSGSRFWSRAAAAVTRRPVLAAAPVVAVLVLAASPLLRVEFGTPDDRVLTTASDVRVVGDALREPFPGNDAKAIQVLTTGEPSPAGIEGFATRLSQLPGVVQVHSSAGTYTAGTRAATNPGGDALAGAGAELLLVGTDDDPRAQTTQDLVRRIRDIEPPAGASALVTGDAARLVDSKEAIGSAGSRWPRA